MQQTGYAPPAPSRPAFFIKASRWRDDGQVNMRMPFHISTKGVNNKEDAHTHFLFSGLAPPSRMDIWESLGLLQKT